MTVELGFTIAGFVFTTLAAVVGVSMYISALRSDIVNNKKLTDQEMKALSEQFKDYKETNTGIFGEIKEELKSLKDLMLEIIRQLPKRNEDSK